MIIFKIFIQKIEEILLTERRREIMMIERIKGEIFFIEKNGLAKSGKCKGKFCPTKKNIARYDYEENKNGLLSVMK